MTPVTPLRPLVFFFPLLGGGCIDYATLSSGFIGCPPQFITVDNEEQHLGTRSWEATCMKKKYQCSFASGTAASCVEMKWKTSDTQP